MIRVFKTGAHSRRTPLSYSALAHLFSDQIKLVKTPQEADIYVFAHTLDIENAPLELVEDWRQRQRPVVLLSEEPFWDSIWGRQPLQRQRLVETHFGHLPTLQLNHHTSEIFQFDQIPYYLLTDHRFANAYQAKFSRNAAVSPAQWRSRFAKRSIDLAFMFERRPEPHHSVHWPEGNLIGLCHWRTEVAQACSQGRIERYGKGWQGNGQDRFQLSHWHLDKILQLDGQLRILGAFENTHQPQYVTEKLFDAFACGALPAYFAAPEQRVHTLQLPPESWLNLYGLEPTAAAAMLDSPNWCTDRFEAYAQAQQKLAALFCTPQTWLRERLRLKAALLTEFTTILDTAQPIWGHAAL